MFLPAVVATVFPAVLTFRPVHPFHADRPSISSQHSTIRRACDRVVFLDKGRVVWQGSVAEFDTTDHPHVSQFREGSLEGPLSF